MWGKSPQPSSIEGWAIFPDGRKRNMCHFLDGNRLCANSTPSFGGELATNEPYAHFAAGGQPSSGARSGMRLRRAGPMAGLSRFTPKIRLIFRWNGARREGTTGGERARRGRADRVAGPEVRICSIPSQNGALSGPPIGTWSVSRQPSSIEGGTGGPRAQSPRLRSPLMAGPWLAPRLAAGPLVRIPPIGFPIGGDRGNLATTPLDGLAEWQHPASPCETGCE